LEGGDQVHGDPSNAIHGDAAHKQAINLLFCGREIDRTARFIREIAIAPCVQWSG